MGKVLLLVMSLVVVLLPIVTSRALTRTSAAQTRDQQEHYLRRFGYLSNAASVVNPAGAAASLQESDPFTTAIRRFQRMAGLRETGEVNPDTIRMMEMPRCGVADYFGTRRKRFALQGSRWQNGNVTYKIVNYTTDLENAVVRREIAKAFQTWSNVTRLDFDRKIFMRADIDIRFAAGAHGDDGDFDGPGKTLAHAYFPQHGGNIHFDEDETWTSQSTTGTNLYYVATHELGHSLGLAHSEVGESIMAPFYRSYSPSMRLHADDIAAIQAIYGRRS